MSQTTVLVIDDSATIRRLVDTHLSQAGYHVVLAPNAEDGIEKAEEFRPDLILLDHQLPGTTGFQVCQQLLQSPDLSRIPVVVSSTLRKKAYAEYTDAANVVDMLPKPFAPELLLTTVANVMETGKLIVDSQSEGTAVPEVIDDMDDVSLAGSFDAFSPREVLDFLNNGGKSGMVELETEHNRVTFYIDRGRVQAVTATGVDPEEISVGLPDALRDLAPIVNFTVGGRFCAEVDGLVQLLDKKVIDHRLLRKLLRHQAALLARRCFRIGLKSFRYERKAVVPPLFRKLPLDISLVALLVDGALGCAESELPQETDRTAYVRSNIRGLNLDRAGLSAQHMKVLSHLNEPANSADLARRLDLERGEVRRVLHGLVLAELVECREQADTLTVFALEHDPNGAQTLRSLLAEGSEGCTGRVVRDQLGLQLLLKRGTPDAVLMAVDTDEFRSLAEKIRKTVAAEFDAVRWVAILPQDGETNGNPPAGFDAVLKRPYTAEDVVDSLESTSPENGARRESSLEEECVASA